MKVSAERGRGTPQAVMAVKIYTNYLGKENNYENSKKDFMWHIIRNNVYDISGNSSYGRGQHKGNA